MKILLITDEVWNDSIHGNNVLSNWFNGFPAEFAQIYCSPGHPDNDCCEMYYQITDKMMINSILNHTKAGTRLQKSEETTQQYNSTDVSNINWMRKYCGNLLRLIKNLVWSFGKYDETAISLFIKEFQPDIIFSPRFATPKMLRLERIVHKYSDCPMVAFTGDNEYSMRMFSLSPFAWINKLWLRKELRRNAKMYSTYYTLSDEQKSEYEKVFSCPIKILRKCASSEDLLKPSQIHDPIKMVYAGKLYCNRWKTLKKIGEAIQKLNTDGCKVLLDIYTKDTLTKKQKKALDLPGAVVLHSAVSQSQVLENYRNCDIALHIESFDLKYRLATRLSFSTKIIDCLSCGCAVMVVAWKEHSGLTYLKRENAAICVDSLDHILEVLTKITLNPELIQNYKLKAIDCLMRNHSRKKVHEFLEDDWRIIIGAYSKS